MRKNDTDEAIRRAGTEMQAQRRDFGHSEAAGRRGWTN